VFEPSVEERLEALNFGVGGYGIADLELLVREKVMSVQPDYVIMMSFNGNDFRDTYLGVQDDIVEGTAVLNEENLRRKVPPEFWNEAEGSKPAGGGLRLWRWLQSLATYRIASSVLGRGSPLEESRVSQRFVSYSFWSRTPYPEVAQRARDETLKAIGRTHEYLDQMGVRLAVVAIPSGSKSSAIARSATDSTSVCRRLMSSASLRKGVSRSWISCPS